MKNCRKEKLPETREEWLAQRQTGLGGSDASAALGMNQYKSAYTLWAEKSGAIIDEVEDNEAMRQGRDLEDYVAKRFTEATGKKAKRSGYCFVSTEYPFMRANVDRLIVGEDAGLECKTASALTKTKYDKGDIPINYYLQCMHYMAVTGCKKWYIAVVVLGKGFYWYEIERDEDEIELLIEKEKEFWQMVEDGTIPDPDGSDSTQETIKKLYPHAVEGVEIELDDDWDRSIMQLMDVKNQIKSLQKMEKEIENSLKAYVKDAAVAFSRNFNVKFKETPTRRLDKNYIKEKYPKIYQEALRESTYKRTYYNRVKD